MLYVEWFQALGVFLSRLRRFDQPVFREQHFVIFFGFKVELMDLFQHLSDLEVVDLSEDFVRLGVFEVMIPVLAKLLCPLVLDDSDPW